MPEKSKEVTRGEIMKVFGFLYTMTTVNISNRRSYWNTEPILFPAPAFGHRFGMGYHRFEEILKAMRFDEEEEDEQDKWKPVRRFVRACNDTWAAAVPSGFKITVDESIFKWYGKGDVKGGLPKVIKIKTEIERRWLRIKIGC